ncbi:MAG TPA: transporter substrate-binding domain-containing protein [Caldilineaceae bacterium]|nr:transporter substrate-binding domain-containing protein [Caldilineaceae bacterium]
MTTFRTHLSKLLILAVVLVATACSSNAQPAVTPSAPAPEPTASTDDVWQRVQERSQLVVGTSVDYPPFEYYNQNFSVDGFDIALMRAIGQELGVTVVFKDIAFEGLEAALSVNQIDAAIAAISVTPDREQTIGFSNIYYVSEDAVLASNRSVPAIRSYADLANFTIGVQKGSVYEELLNEQLIEPGLMRPTNLFTYSSIDRAVADLQQGLVALVLLDLGPAQNYANSNANVELVGQGLTRERYAIAVPQGAGTLRTAINGALDALRERGVVSGLVQRYLDLQQNEVQPIPTAIPPTAVPPTTEPTATPTTAAPAAPTATAQPQPQPGACTDAMAYIADLNYDDQNMTQPPVFTPGQPFRKGWRVRNTGSCTWNTGYSMTFVEGNSPSASMGGRATAVNGPVPPGATYDLYVDLVAPINPGLYQGTWQMRNAQGTPFGERVWVGISVPGRPGPTAVPTQTPSPNITFTVDRNSIRAGECVVFQWNVNSVTAIYFYAEGQRWEDNGVGGQESRQICLDRTTNYYLRVVRQDNSVETKQITVNVQATGAPNIARFTVDPSPKVPAGQCVNLYWEVQGNVQRVKLLRNNQTIWDDAPYSGTKQDCPPGTGGVDYTIEATGPGGTNRSSNHIDLVEQQATATPMPTAAPAPVVSAFSVNPNQITTGQCVSLAWSTGGSTDHVRLSRNGAVILDNGPVNSSGLQDCLDQPGTTTYVIEAFGGGQSAIAQAQVDVSAPEQPTPTPAPQAPVINSFVVDRTNITFGECVNLSWQFGGDSLATSQLFRNDELIASDVPLSGSQEDCPPTPGNVAYQLKVDSEFGGIAQQFQYVSVEDVGDAGNLPETPPTDGGEGAVQLPETPPVIESFTADTTQIDVGGCVNLAWSFSGTSIVNARLLRNDGEIAFDLLSPGSYQDCVTDDTFVGTVVYRLVVDAEFAGSSAAEQFVTVVGG